MRPRDGRLIRPLLSVTREDTAAHCAARGLPWREDTSNDSDAYARNRARAGLVPALRELHPAAEANVLRTVELLGEEAAVLEAVVAEVLAGERAIEVARLAALPPALRRLICSRLAEDAAGRPVPAAARRADELLELGAGSGSAALDLGGGVRAVVEYGRLRMLAEPDADPPEPVRLPVPGSVRFGGQEVAAAAVWGAPTVADGVLDAAALAAELVVRAWEPGDRMAPLGLDGTATLQDLFTDRRVPRSRRHELPVVVSDGEIAWVPGVATGERFRVTAATERAVRLTVRPVTLAP
jgi:tRNA(Ile)-lysidine synthase